MASCLPVLSCYPVNSHTPACTPLATLPASCSLAPPGGTIAAPTAPHLRSCYYTTQKPTGSRGGVRERAWLHTVLMAPGPHQEKKKKKKSASFAASADHMTVS